MSEAAQLLSQIRRPRLLMRAARIAMREYNRERDLKRVLRQDRLLSPLRMLERLIVLEEALEESRVSGDAAYNACQHIEALVAMIAEARLIKARPAA